MKSLALLWLAVCCFGAALARRVPTGDEEKLEPCSHAPPPTDKVVLCYYEGRVPVNRLDPCLCTHIVFSEAADVTENFTVIVDPGVAGAARRLRHRNPRLSTLLGVGGSRLSPNLADALLRSGEKRARFAASTGNALRHADLQGVELQLDWTPRRPQRDAKAALVALLKNLRYELDQENDLLLEREKRAYDVFESIIDDYTTSEWTPTRPDGSSLRISRRSTTSSTSTTSTEGSRSPVAISAAAAAAANYLELEHPGFGRRLLLLRVPHEPEVMVKRFDFKNISKFVDYMTVPSDNITDTTERGVTYHPSRLMGISDLLNTDSMLDLLTGLGAPHSQLIITVPAAGALFTLADASRNTPRSVATSGPEAIAQTQLCKLLGQGGWTIERDDDLTAPYAFKNKTWIGFDDILSMGIKSKYVLVRGLAGAALNSVDDEDWSGGCSRLHEGARAAASLLRTLHRHFTELARKPRAALLQALEEEVHEAAAVSYSGEVQLSPYRIVRVIDNLGAVHVVRKNAKTEFECSRQGYYAHPLGCNRFYRCVKFNQYSRDYTVFEYDCPAGLAFDERWEVCVWPGSLPRGAPCSGSSEIAPVPRARYTCPRVEGYFADPENCRWFFACLDHARDGATPLTAYEFRCPFGLLFDESRLLCDWPWNLESCGASGRAFVAGGAAFAQGIHYEAALFGDAARSGPATGISGVYSSDGSGAARTIHTSASVSNLGLTQKAQAAYSSAVHTGAVSGNGAFVVGSGRSNAYAAGSYNEGRQYSAFGSIPDSLVSGGRVVGSGGVVLGENVAVSLNEGSRFGLLEGISAARANQAAAANAAAANAIARNAANAGTGLYVSDAQAANAAYAANAANAAAAARANLASNGGVYVSDAQAANAAYAANAAAHANAAAIDVANANAAVAQAAHAANSANAANAQAAYNANAINAAHAANAHAAYNANGINAAHAAHAQAAYKANAINAAHAANAQAAYNANAINTANAANAQAAYNANAINAAHAANAQAAYAANAVNVANARAAQQTQAAYSNAAANAARLSNVANAAVAQNIFGSRGTSIVSGAVPVAQPVPIVQQVPTAVYTRPIAEVRPALRVQTVTARPAVAIQPVSVTQPVVVSHPVGLVQPAVAVQPLQHVTIRPTLQRIQPVSVVQQVRPSIQSVPVIQDARPNVQTISYQPVAKTVIQPTAQTYIKSTPLLQPVVNGIAIQPTVQPYSVQPTAQSVPLVQPAVQVQQVHNIRPVVPVVQKTPAVSVFRRPVAQPVTVIQPHVQPISVVQQVAKVIPAQPVLQQQAYVQQPIQPIQYVQSTPRPISIVQPTIQPVVQPVSVVHRAQPVPFVQPVQQVPIVQPIAQPLPVQPITKTIFRQRLQPTLQPTLQQIPVVQPVAQAVPLRPAFQQIPVVQPVAQAVPLRPAIQQLPVLQPAVKAIPVQPIAQAIPVQHVAHAVPVVRPTVQPVSLVQPAIAVQPTVQSVPVVQANYGIRARVRTRPVIQPVQPVFQQVVQQVAPVAVEQRRLRPRPFAVIPTASPAPAISVTAAPAVAVTPASVSFSRAFYKTPVVLSTPAQEGFIPVTTPRPAYTLSSGYQTARRKNAGLVSTVVPPATLEYQRPTYAIPAAEIAAAYPTGNEFQAGYLRVNGQNGLRGAALGYSRGQIGVDVAPAVASGVRTVYEESFTARPQFIQSYSTAGPSNVYLPAVKTVGVVSTTPRPAFLDVVTRRPSTDYVIAAPKIAVTPSVRAGITYAGSTTTTRRPTVDEYVAKSRTAASRLEGVNRKGFTARPRGEVGRNDPAVQVLLDQYSEVGSLNTEKNDYIHGVLLGDTLRRIAASTAALDSSTVGTTLGLSSTTEGYSSTTPIYLSSSGAYSSSTEASVRRGQGSGRYRAQGSRARVSSDGDSAVVNALLDNYSGNFGGVLDGNKEGFIQSVISQGSAGRTRGRISSSTISPAVQSTTQAIIRDGPSTARSGDYESSYEDVQSLLDQYSGKFGGVLESGKEEFISDVLSGRVSSTTAASASRGRVRTRTKEPVVVISRLSDVNPLLISKLGAQCTCKSQPVTLNRGSGRGRARIVYDDDGDESDEDGDGAYDSGDGYGDRDDDGSRGRAGGRDGDGSRGRSGGRGNDGGLGGDNGYGRGRNGGRGRGDARSGPRANGLPSVLDTNLALGYSTIAPGSVAIPVRGSRITAIPASTIRPVAVTTVVDGARVLGASTTALPISPRLSVAPIVVGAAAPVTVAPLLSTTVSAPTVLVGQRVRSRGPAKGAGVVVTNAVEAEDAGRESTPFDRYGPGGWRSLDETLQGSVDCQRPGLFRHPKYCNKFYACHWDQWKGRYTLHVFNCPVHLAYDQQLGACNWPSQGPGCADNQLLL